MKWKAVQVSMQTHSLIYEVDVRAPHLVGRNPQNVNVIIFLWVPRQPVVCPFLAKMEGRNKRRKKAARKGRQKKERK